ncbi:hypothetical protein JB92DRAFT_2903581 [Gautieria morchelliformis]|nr:hypothetical protein JB92DRAFT_2903581 [Gautieria morchelliformis]
MVPFMHQWQPEAEVQVQVQVRPWSLSVMPALPPPPTTGSEGIAALAGTTSTPHSVHCTSRHQSYIMYRSGGGCRPSPRLSPTLNLLQLTSRF